MTIVEPCHMDGIDYWQHTSDINKWVNIKKHNINDNNEIHQMDSDELNYKIRIKIIDQIDHTCVFCHVD
jgi:hypothetical protein